MERIITESSAWSALGNSPAEHGPGSFSRRHPVYTKGWLDAQVVVANAEPDLARAAVGVRAKIATIVPGDLHAIINNPVTGTLPPAGSRQNGGIDFCKLRRPPAFHR